MAAVPLEPDSNVHTVDAAMMRRLEVHEARAHAGPSRQLVDLGDAILLHDPVHRDSFVNRVSALRLPPDPAAFDRRLAELVATFATLDRRPCAWLAPLHGAPPDLEQRLVGHGFRVTASAYVMLHDSDALASGRRATATTGAGATSTDPGRRIARLSEAHRADRSRLLADAAGVMIAAFDADPDTLESVAAELGDSHADVCVAYEDGRPVASGRRYTAGGLDYLSSIGTLPSAQGRGHATRLVETLVADAIADGSTMIFLAVETTNPRARAVYEHAGFRVLGNAAPSLMLE